MKKFISNAILLITYFVVTNPVLAQLSPWQDPNRDGNIEDSCLIDDVPTLKCLEVVTNNLMILANGLILLVLFIMFLIGSFKWLTSLGSPDKIEEAKGTFQWAIIGLIVYLSAGIILYTIDALFLGGQGKIFQFKIGGP